MKLFRQPKFWNEIVGLASNAAGLFPAVDPNKVRPTLNKMNPWKEDSLAYRGETIKLAAKAPTGSTGRVLEYRWKFQIADKKGGKLAAESQTTRENYLIIPDDKTPKGSSIHAECVLFDTGQNRSLGKSEKTYQINDSFPCENFISTLISVAGDSLRYLGEATDKVTYKEKWEKSPYANPLKRIQLRSGDVVMRTGGKMSEVMRRIATPWAEVTHAGLVELKESIHFVHQIVATGYEVVPLSREDKEKIEALRKSEMLRMRSDSPKLPDKLKADTTFLDESLVGSVRVYRISSVQRPDGQGWKPDPLSPMDWDLENLYGDTVIKQAKKLGSKVKFYDWLAVESSMVGREQETIAQMYYCTEFVRDCIAKVFPGYDPKPRQSETLRKIWQSIFDCDRDSSQLARKHEEWVNLVIEMIRNLDPSVAPEEIKKAVIELLELVLKGGIAVYLKQEISEGVRKKVQANKVLHFLSILVPDHLKTLEVDILTKRFSLKGIKTVEEELYIEFIDDLSSTLGTGDLVPLSLMTDKIQMRWRQVAKA